MAGGRSAPGASARRVQPLDSAPCASPRVLVDVCRRSRGGGSASERPPRGISRRAWKVPYVTMGRVPPFRSWRRWIRRRIELAVRWAERTSSAKTGATALPTMSDVLAAVRRERGRLGLLRARPSAAASTAAGCAEVATPPACRSAPHGCRDDRADAGSDRRGVDRDHARRAAATDRGSLCDVQGRTPRRRALHARLATSSGCAQSWTS